MHKTSRIIAALFLAIASPAYAAGKADPPPQPT